MSDPRPNVPNCGCCAGIDAATPRRLHNPPGLAAIAYRVGRHGDFLESMRARLSSADLPALAALTTREASDFTLALGDALAASLDVLTFYTERVANEHYLRTATERLSVREMARLIGYELAPGVAASTYLAFTLKGVPGAPVEPITLPVGTRVQSVPGQDEQAQSFETIEPAPARAEWNAIPVKASTPWRPAKGDTELWLDGLATQLQPGDALLVVGQERLTTPGNEQWDVRVLDAVEPDTDNQRTRVHWKRPLGSVFPPMDPAATAAQVQVFRQRTALFGHNAPDANLMSANNTDSNVGQLIDKGGSTGSFIGMIGLLATGSRWEWKDFTIDPPTIDLDTDNAKIVAGGWIALVSNEPGRGSADLPGYTELYRAEKVIHRTRNAFGISGKITRIHPDTDENLTAARYPLRRTLVLAQSERLVPAATPLRHPVHGDALVLGRREDGLRPGQPLALSGRRQRLGLAPEATGLSLALDDGDSVALEGGDELLLLAPAVRLLGASGGQALAADAFAALIGTPGIRLRLALMDRDGRRGTLVAYATQVRLLAGRDDDARVSEIAFIATTDDAITLERDHTMLRLQASLTHVYERASLRANANVAPATHGESIETILGSGDAGTANQRLALDQAPLTFVGADTPSGRASTLEVRVNDVQWQEVPSLHGQAPERRVFETRRDDAGVTTVQFGDGREGARLPSGESNLRARYRKGLGVAGNLAANRITTLLSRPLGVSEATNPVPATGGEDAETLARARDNAPLTVLTLERAVSIDDYANFARAFAGIDKAHALWLPAGPAQGVFLTLAGVDGAELPATGDTLASLRQALVGYGDPLVPLRLVNYVDARFRCRLAVKVRAAFAPDPVMVGVEAALRGRFGFAQRAFGQAVSVDEVAAVAQAVRGVEAVHVTRLHRLGMPPAVEPRLFAALPVDSLTTLPQAAELLTLDAAPLELEVLP
ncbi:putative baseplate assembly protein [Halomonas maura]|uniref:putative baseplate assembly protein n=1 Tax=Halomonas maura TaxID=117606 RepID=UPI0025B4DC45|nr:putative baseplate assembly protein [Halomonas maura]MDN3556265.1 putative baseplate assembly protein [Halomonas maura]